MTEQPQYGYAAAGDDAGPGVPEPGYRKLAAGVGLGGPLGLMIPWVVGLIDQALPGLDMSMPPNVGTAFGVFLAGLLFYLTKEQAR